MRIALLLVLLLVPTLSAGAEPEPASAPASATIAQEVLDAFKQLDLGPREIRVRDLAFWKQWSPRLLASGRMVEFAQMPSERDGLRPRILDRVLRGPLEAVGLAAAVRNQIGPPPLDVLVGASVCADLALGADPIPADVAAHANVRWLARRLAALEDAVVAALPEGEPDSRMPRWMIAGIEQNEVEEARQAFERFEETDLEPALHLVLGFVLELTPRAHRHGEFDVGGPLRVETPRGLVIVGSNRKDVHEEDAWLLVDPGGNDTYRNNAGGTGTTRHAGLCLDLRGNDRYESELPFTQGAAWQGLSLLIDVQGNDRYQGDEFCQGAAVGGVSLLLDIHGKDVFEASNFAQGAAALGYGMLWSRRGNDTFAIDHMGQGFARTGGYGVLHDREGDDHYLTRPTHESMYSKWTDGRKVYWSFAQGCGLGFYGRYEETLPDGSKGLVIRDMLPGGVGMLKDGGGNDRYEGSMYAQGTGYFYGLGICLDVTGDDTYTASWYGQGAAPHFAVGILVDGGGNDRYTGMHQVQGNGRDFSTGVFLDFGGDDVYVGEDRVQGCGDRRDGYGIFVDAGGDDRYDAKRRAARGWTTLVKPEEQPTAETPYADYGVFLDLGGKDVYEGKAAGADGTTWKQAATGRAIGIDR